MMVSRYGVVAAALGVAGLLWPLAARGTEADAADATPAAPSRRGDVEARLRGRTFPSVFQAWNPADNVKNEPRAKTLARHDLVFHGPGYFGLRWDGSPGGVATRFDRGSVIRGTVLRRQFLALNPNMILLAEIRYRDAPSNFLPRDHPWWRRKDGRVVPGWGEGGYLQLDFSNPDFRRHVAQRARAVVETGVVDGVMLDWWHDDDDRLALAQAVREAVGPDALIMVNANDRKTPRTAPYVNGYFMECTRSATPDDWQRLADTLVWAEANLRSPRVNCLETWYHHSRQDLNLMRATTALVLTHSDGYALFSDPNPLPKPDHGHDWYPFWDKGLGRPKGAGAKRPDGVFVREFEGGLAAYNPMGNGEVVLEFDEDLTSRATGRRGKSHRLAPCDGDILLRAPVPAVSP
ncbi:MAG TPA: hypothetical protein VM431_04335 [Phycisphaerae bacterium]|nr:hypothetical protein [Phycisphaerae bacterium]